MSPLPQISITLTGGGVPDAARRRLPAESLERETSRALRRWNLETLAGGITEISGPTPAAGLTAAARLVREAQERDEPAAWVAAGDSLFFAPDLHDWGVDLRALPVVQVDGALAAARAAECLLRSGAFVLVVFDLTRTGGSAVPAPGAGPSRRPVLLPTAIQVRLAALCRRHEATLLLLAQKSESTPPIASLAILRAEGTVRKTGFDQFTFELKVLKDKRQGTGWSHEEVLRGPDGLC
jgi:recombination protein RecA